MSSTISVNNLLYRKLLENYSLAASRIMPGEPGWEVTGETIDAPANASYIYGTEFNDSITLGEGCHNVYGKSGDDLITGTVAAFVYGDEGNDRIEISGEAREIYGGAGADAIVVGDKSRFVHGEAGDDVINAGDDCHSIWGEDGDDVITVGKNAATVNGGLGNDHITAGNGAGSINGNEGDDTIDVGNDATSIYGNGGNDTIRCKDNATTIYGDGGTGEAGDDIIIAGNNAYDILGNDGNDEITVGDNARLIDGGNGNDKITAGNYAETIRGQAGNDIIVVGDDAKQVLGGAGDDTITAGGNATNLQGEDGDDTITAKDNASNIDGGNGNDEIAVGNFASDIRGGNGDDAISVGDNADNITGGNGDDKITAGSDSKNILGGPDRDEITAGDYAFNIYGDQRAPFASDGDDIITLGKWANYVFGMGGNDTITVGDYAGRFASDVDLDADWGIHGGSGNDVIKAGDSCRFLYGETGEDRIEVGNDAFAIYGGAGDDAITAGDKANELYGEEGDDIITAGADSEKIYGGAGNDTITVGDGATQIYGDEGNDLITAGNNAKHIYGGLGADTIIVGENASFIICEGTSASQDFQDGNNILISNYVDQMYMALGSNGNDIIIGNLNTPSLELLSSQMIVESFEILLRAITDDVMPLDFTSHERLESYGITINPASAQDAVTLSDLWSFSPEKTTPYVDVFTSFQNGVVLELELMNYKPWGLETVITASEKELGKPQEITLAQEGYYISHVFAQGEYGHLEETDGRWYYILDQAIDSGPVAGENAVENADTVWVELKNAAGQTLTGAIQVTIIDDVPEITISDDQTQMAVYISADGYAYNIFINDVPWEGVIDASTTEVQLEGNYGTLTLSLESVHGTKEPLWFTGSMDYVSSPDASESGTDVFVFRLSDGDGDVAENSAAFTSEIIQPDSPVNSIDQLTFLEENLYNGSAPDYMQLVKNGKLTYDLPSGLAGLQIAHNGANHVIPDSGYENLITDKGIFSVWHEEGAIEYSFILSDPVSGSRDADTLAFEAILTDNAGNYYAGNEIFIHIVDDSPRILETKTWTVDNANPEISGNAGDCYLAGADGGVFSWKMDAGLRAEIAKYGSLTLESDGAWSFTLSESAPAPAGPLALVYGFEDADGDSITGHIYIDIAG